MPKAKPEDPSEPEQPDPGGDVMVAPSTEERIAALEQLAASQEAEITRLRAFAPVEHVHTVEPDLAPAPAPAAQTGVFGRFDDPNDRVGLAYPSWGPDVEVVQFSDGAKYNVRDGVMIELLEVVPQPTPDLVVLGGDGGGDEADAA